MQQIEAELDDFFASSDSSSSNDPNAEKEKVEVELIETMGMYERGIESGKV